MRHAHVDVATKGITRWQQHRTRSIEAADLLSARIRELDAERVQARARARDLTDGREGRRGPGPPARARARPPTTPPPPPRGGTRADQAVKLIEANPGITASEIAKKMKIKPNYLYRVLGDLEKEGRVDARTAAPTAR